MQHKKDFSVLLKVTFGDDQLVIGEIRFKKNGIETTLYDPKIRLIEEYSNHVYCQLDKILKSINVMSSDNGFSNGEIISYLKSVSFITLLNKK